MVIPFLIFYLIMAYDVVQSSRFDRQIIYKNWLDRLMEKNRLLKAAQIDSTTENHLGFQFWDPKHFSTEAVPEVDRTRRPFHPPLTIGRTKKPFFQGLDDLIGYYSRDSTLSTPTTPTTTTGDMTNDFEFSTTDVNGCRYTKFTSWSGCSTDCGWGTQHRIRWNLPQQIRLKIRQIKMLCLRFLLDKSENCKVSQRDIKNCKLRDCTRHDWFHSLPPPLSSRVGNIPDSKTTGITELVGGGGHQL